MRGRRPGRDQGRPAAPVPPALRSAVRARLLAWYDAGHRRLPWRSAGARADPYRVWLAEVMLQQTRVGAVVPYYRRFLARWPTLEALAAAPDEQVLAAWSGLGYYARCRNLLRAAREALRRHGGLPHSLEDLRRLPGFGPYTAGAVASIAFGLRAPALDGNAARVLSRLFLVDGDLAAAGTRRRLRALAGEVVPAARPGDFNQALMELGATVCGRSPACGRCPLAAPCRARRAGREREIPAARARPRRAPMALACAAVERKGALLLARRDGRGLFGGLWELPAAEVEPGAEPRRALRAALERSLGRRARLGAELASVERTLTHRDLTLTAYRCRLLGRESARGSAEVRWAEPEELGGLAMATAMRSLVERLLGAAGRAGHPDLGDGHRRGGRDERRARRGLTSRVPTV